MDVKGVRYDVGRKYNDWFLTRQVFDPAATRRELRIVRDDLHAEGMDGAFVWTFADPRLTYRADPRHDLDMTSTSLVKTHERGPGTTYPGLPWEPKPAFGAVASFYAAR